MLTVEKELFILPFSREAGLPLTAPEKPPAMSLKQCLDVRMKAIPHTSFTTPANTAFSET